MQSLKQLPIWVCWKRDPDRGKIPKNPFTGGNAMSNNSQTWSDYNTALQASKQFDGIGFMFAGGICGIDIDGEDGHTKDNPLSAELLDLFKGTYIEKSPSGSGYHIIFKCDMSRISSENGKLSEAYYQKNPHNGIECYFSGLTKRYFTFTGNMVSDAETVTNQTEQVLLFLDKYMKRSGKDKQPVKVDYAAASDPAAPLVLSNTELIERAFRFKDGAKYQALWRGDISGYDSPSNADQALCNLLAFLTGKDCNRIDALFRQSGLMRDKWDEMHGAMTYGAMTIQKAIEGCKNTYSPQYKRSSDEGGGLPPFIIEDVNEKTGAVKYFVYCPALAQYIRENERYFFLKTPGEKQYIYWYNRKCGVYEPLSDNRFKGIIKAPIEAFDKGLVKMRDIDETFKQLITDCDKDVEPEKLDSREDLINFNNGFLVLSSLTLIPHTPEIFSTIQIPCNWNPQARDMPVFKRYINDLTDGNVEEIELLLEYGGLVMSNIRGTIDKSALFLVGKGHTGKSQYPRTNPHTSMQYMV